jgi:hypothetical protein
MSARANLRGRARRKEMIMQLRKVPLCGLKSIAALMLVLGLLAGCSGEAAPVKEQKPTSVKFDPANFVDPTTSTNPYHPTRPGIVWVRSGTTEVGSRKVPHTVISTMTDVIRMIDGVPCVAMLDQSTDSGQVSQIGFDYFALDKDGNLWIMGGYTEDYQGGQYTNVDSVSLGTASGGVPGILMPGVIKASTPRWFIGTSGPKEKPSVAEPVAVGLDQTVKFGRFHNVVAIREGNIGAIDNEIKYYAPGVGVILNTPQLKSLHQDDFQLINMFTLSPKGLAEASQVVLNLEKHARKVAPKIYGSAPLAKRAK